MVQLKDSYLLSIIIYILVRLIHQLSEYGTVLPEETKSPLSTEHLRQLAARPRLKPPAPNGTASASNHCRFALLPFYRSNTLQYSLAGSFVPRSPSAPTGMPPPSE